MLRNDPSSTAIDRALSKDFVAASSVPLILSILSHGDSYGYEIIRRVRELSDGEMRWADGMLYPILHRLEKRGLIESYWGSGDGGGRRRRYYRLRQPGIDELASLRTSWKRMSTMLQRLEGGGTHV
ncbi:MAG: PadR family transcriptional regulator [Candidatus Limnocylindria bacterium]